jgi:predicted transcriptional regulator
MTTLTIDVPTDIYERLRNIAEQRQTTVEAIAQGWLAEKSAAATVSNERERLRAVLRAAGKLAELSPEEKRRAAQSTLSLEEARAILDRAGGKPLSEIILDMRGPKE